MSFRIKASVIAATAAACALLTPTAMASPGLSHSPVQVTGKQLKGALLPPSRFQPGYVTLFSANSGGSLEHGTTLRIPSLKCSDFWSFIGVGKGFGETAMATETAASKSPTAPVQEIFDQTVYQAASNKAAASLFSQISAKYQSCKSASVPDGHGGTLKHTVHARAVERVGGHQSLLLTEFLTDTKIPGPPSVTVALWTLDGTDVYLVDSQLLSVSSPKPTLASLMLKLIPRVRALK